MMCTDCEKETGIVTTYFVQNGIVIVGKDERLCDKCFLQRVKPYDPRKFFELEYNKLKGIGVAKGYYK